MVEAEKNPLAVRQGAATIMCLAAAAVAMPVISYRAAEQREGAEWAATSRAFQAEFESQVLADPEARIELTSLRTGDGLRARGSGLAYNMDARGMMVHARLRGPSEAVNNPAPRIDRRQQNCLAQAIYYEARGESRTGQEAVAEVVMNRVASPAYPNSICGVVYQGSERTTGCQFTFTCDGSLDRAPRGRAWTRALDVAKATMQGYTRRATQRATHYHTTAVNPYWSAGLVETTRIGTHIFYRFPNRAERPIYQAAMARRRAVAGPRREYSIEPDAPAPAALEADAIVAPEASPEPAPADAPVQTAPAETSADASGVTGEIAT